MKYTVEEEFALSAYQAIIKFDEKVSSYQYSDDFSIVIQDILLEKQTFIDKDTLCDYGLTKTDRNISDWENDSFIKNNGILIYYPDEYSILIKLLARCTDNNNNMIGNNSCNIHIDIGDKDKNNIDVNAVIWPKVIRDHEFKKITESAEDPIISASRQEYDFDNTNTYYSVIPTNYAYNSTDSIYLSNSAGIPVYYNEVSAYYPPADSQSFTFNVSASTLINTMNGKATDIDYIEEKTSAAIEIPFGEKTYTANVNCNIYRQILDADISEKIENRLYLGFDLSTTEDNGAAIE